MSELTPTPASEWEAPYAEGTVMRLPSGMVASLYKLNLLPEMLEGTVPNLVVKHVIFGEALQLKPEDPIGKAQQTLQSLYYIAAKGLAYPKLIISREPNRAKDEIGPRGIKLQDLLAIAQYSLWSVLPEVADAPFLDTVAEGDWLEGILAAGSGDGAETLDASVWHDAPQTSEDA